MIKEIQISHKEGDLKRLETREKEIDSCINDLWLMQTPERVENLPSPQYVITKEDNELDSNKLKINRLQPPHPP